MEDESSLVTVPLDGSSGIRHSFLAGEGSLSHQTKQPVEKVFAKLIGKENVSLHHSWKS